jgi:hypothetical protein
MFGSENVHTTVTVDTIVAEYLALHLGTEPGTVEAHSAVRQCLQRQLDDNNDPDRSRTSQWLLGQIVEAIARPSLVGVYGQWLDTKIAQAVKEFAWMRWLFGSGTEFFEFFVFLSVCSAGAPQRIVDVDRNTICPMLLGARIGFDALYLMGAIRFGHATTWVSGTSRS